MERPFIQTSQGIINLLHVVLIDSDLTGCRIVLAGQDAPLLLKEQEAVRFLDAISGLQVAETGKPARPPRPPETSVV